MTEALWRKVGNSLVPMDVVTEDLLGKTQNGALVVTSEPRSRRNPDHHRWMMAVLAKVVENTDHFADVEDLMLELKLRCRMGSYSMRRGRLVFVPRSISFAAMSQQQFKRVTDRWLYLISTEIMPGVDPETLLDEARSAA